MVVFSHHVVVKTSTHAELIPIKIDICFQLQAVGPPTLTHTQARSMRSDSQFNASICITHVHSRSTKMARIQPPPPHRLKLFPFRSPPPHRALAPMICGGVRPESPPPSLLTIDRSPRGEGACLFQSILPSSSPVATSDASARGPLPPSLPAPQLTSDGRQ